MVLDTNVVLSALLFRKGSLSWLREQWRGGTFLPLVSRETTLELVRVLAYPKFRLSEDDRNELLADYLPWCETVVTSSTVAIPDCRDPADRHFLRLAIEGGADVLVSGDADLLTLAISFPIPIVVPAKLRLDPQKGITWE